MVDIGFVRGSPMVPLVGNICTIGTNLITNGTIGKEIGANDKNGNTSGTNGTNVTNQWYHWENPHTRIVYLYNVFQINLLLNPDLLYTYISIDQLPPVLEGLYQYNHDDWIRFHMVSTLRHYENLPMQILREFFQ